AVTEGDKTEAESRFGVSVNTWRVNELAAAVDEVPDSEVDALVKEYGELYDIADELRPGADRHESLRYAARQEAAIRGFLEAHNATAFTTPSKTSARSSSCPVWPCSGSWPTATASVPRATGRPACSSASPR